MMKQPRYQQLPLSFEPREHYSFENFVSGCNQLAVDLVRQMAANTGEAQVFIWAERGKGKSHLLQAACNLADRLAMKVCYLPVRQFVRASPEIFEGLEQLDMVCIDDIDIIISERPWEEALFDLINRLRDCRKRLLLASACSPDSCDIGLPDLRSRLQWGPVFYLRELDDADKVKALKMRADQYGLEMTDSVANYLMTHYPRDLFGLFERLDYLDKASMAMQRRLTVPFVKTVLDAD